jgi:type VI protein secretion system component Hcp
MTMKLVFLCFLVFAVTGVQAQVGIGTTTPNTNAVLDLSSSNKALLLPRVADTSVVASPAAGMVVYSQQSHSPNFHDGARWNNLENSAGNSLYGSMTYTVTGTAAGGIPYETGPLAAIDLGYYTFVPINIGGGGGSTGSLQKADSLTFSKEFDGNSIVFKRAHFAGFTIPSIEIDQFLPAGTKFYSIKLNNVIISSQLTYISEETGKLTERYSFTAAVIGFKDWINNKSFSYNTSTRAFGTY